VMLFAGDSGMMSHKSEELEMMTRSFFTNAAKFGQMGSIPKTEWMHQRTRKTQKRKKEPQRQQQEGQQSHEPNTTIKLNDGQEIKKTGKFKYLGSIFEADFEKRIQSDVSRRIILARSTFSRYYHSCFKHKHFRMFVKITIFKLYVVPVLLYGCEAWTTDSGIFKRLESTQFSMLLTIIGKSRKNHIKYIDVLHTTKMRCVEAEVRKRQLRFLGHVQRMGSNRMPKQILYGELEEGTRTRGGQISSWRENARSNLNLFGINEDDWSNLAESKDDWEEYIKGDGMEAFVQQWEDDREEAYQLRKAREGNSNM